MNHSIFESVKLVLEGAEIPKEQYRDMLTVARSMRLPFGDIDSIERDIKKGNRSGELLLKIFVTIANDTTLFNTFVKEYKKQALGLREESELDDGFDNSWVVYDAKKKTTR